MRNLLPSQVEDLLTLYCRWPPCDAKLRGGTRGRYCSTLHRVNAAQQVDLLRQLVNDIDEDGPVSRGMRDSTGRPYTPAVARRIALEKIELFRPEVHAE